MRHCRSIPLGLVTASVPGQALVDNTALLEAREAEFKLDTTKPFKINADTNGVCGSSRLGDRSQIITEVRRSCVVHDAFALAKAGYLQLSAALNLAHELRAEKECECRVHAHCTMRS